MVKMSLEERIEKLVEMKSIEGISSRAYARLMKEMAKDTGTPTEKVRKMFEEKLREKTPVLT